MVKTLLIVLAVVVAGLIVVIAMQPAAFTITRSATIAAPPAAVYALVNDFHKWDAWSPWAKLDPAMKQSYEGAAFGTGAGYKWSGNDKAGEGRMTILESQPDDHVRIKLEFTKPFASTNTTEFKLKPEGSGVNVQWTMSGENNFMAKGFGLVMNMDKLVGADFEKGLAQMKSVAESGAKP